MAYSVQSCGKAHPHCKVCKPDVSAKISAARARRTPEQRAKIRAKQSATVKRRTPEQQAKISAKISAARIGQRLTDETRAKISAKANSQGVKSCGNAHAYCKECRPEVSQNISAAKMGGSMPPRSAEHRANISAALTGRVRSEEHKEALRAARSTPEGRDRASRRKDHMAAFRARQLVTCGKTHASCRLCRPDLTGAGRQHGWATGIQSIKSCGKAHAWCGECRPDQAEHLREVARRHVEVCSDSGCRRLGCGGPIHSPTKIENTLVNVLLAEFPEVIRERKFGRYRVDAYLPPPYHIAFEADGTYWHEKREREQPGYDVARDAYLMVEHDLPVVRLGEADLLGMIS